MLSGLLREENALPLVDRKRKKDAKDTRKRDGAAPPLDRIPLPAVPLSIIQERRHMQREAQKKLKISPNNPPSVCLYTILNAPNGVCSASFSENLEALAVGYGNSTIQLHALGIKSFRQLKPAEELETLDNDYEDISESMYDESTKNETIELNGHLGSVHSVNFSCDRRLLLSGSRDETVRLWNLDLRRNIVVYRMDAPVWDSQFSIVECTLHQLLHQNVFYCIRQSEFIRCEFSQMRAMMLLVSIFIQIATLWLVEVTIIMFTCGIC